MFRNFYTWSNWVAIVVVIVLALAMLMSAFEADSTSRQTIAYSAGVIGLIAMVLIVVFDFRTKNSAVISYKSE